jgi:hypothetical protein
MKFGPPGKYEGDPISVPVFYVLAIYQDAFRAQKRVIEIRTAEPLSPISVGDYLTRRVCQNRCGTSRAPRR